MAAAGHILALSMQSNDPTKLRIFFGISSLFPSFLGGESRVGHFLDLLTKVNVITSAGAERFGAR